MILLDEGHLARLVEQLAAQLGFDLESCSTLRQTLGAIEREPSSLALINMAQSDVTEQALLARIHSAAPDCDVVFLGAPETRDGAIRSVRLGAREHVTEPFDVDRLRQVLNHRRHEMARRAHVFELEARIAEETQYHGMIGRSPAMQGVFDLIQRLAPHARRVLIAGETGTGKELAAHAFHEVGPRRAQPFVTVNCSTCTDRFFMADPGDVTVFFDEIADLPMALQVVLMERIEEWTAANDGDTRRRAAIIASSSRDLHREAAAGRFHPTLLEHLGAVTLTLPPLRDRREDIPFLTAAFISACALRFGKPLEGVTPAAERLLRAARWDGNVRELRGAVEGACMLAAGRLVSDRDLGQACPFRAPHSPAVEARALPSAAALNPGHAEREATVSALRQANGNRLAAATALGISRRALYRRLARHRITEPSARSRNRRI